MKNKRVLITAECEDSGEVTNYMRPIFDSLVNQGFQVYSVYWKNIDENAHAEKVHDVSKGKILNEVNLNDLTDFFHLFQMGPIYEGLSKLKEIIRSLDDNFEGIKINDPSTMLDNMDKSYLLRLQDKRFKIPETTKFSSSEKVNQIKSNFEQGEKHIIKPINGERGNFIMPLENLTDDILKKISANSSEILVQKFIPEIYEGEKSLIFLGDTYSHGILKLPPEGSFYSHIMNGGTALSYSPTREEINLGFAVREAWPTPINVMRLDMVSNNEGKPLIMEVELINPDLFFKYTEDFKGFAERLGQYYTKILK